MKGRDRNMRGCGFGSVGDMGEADGMRVVYMYMCRIVYNQI